MAMLKHLLTFVVIALSYLTMGALDHVPQLHQQKCFQYDADVPVLNYNPLRYYSSQIGIYISSDPIGLAGNNPTLYGYVGDVNTWLDVWGLEIKRIYEKEPYHGIKDNSIKSRAPIDGEGALDNSIQVKETNPRRVGIDPTTNEFVILVRT